MAQIRYNFFGPVIILEHDEVDEAVATLRRGGDVAKFLATILPAIPALVLKAVDTYLQVSAALVEKFDQGGGVYLTMLWATPGLVIPTTRPPGIGLPADWVNRGSGQFRTEDSADLVEYRIEPNAVGSDVVEFRLEANNPRMWRKVLVIRDDAGGRWDIAIDPSQGTTSAVNGLWAHQVHGGQTFSLWKAKQLGMMTWVLDFGNLESLQPGSRVVFSWLLD